MQELNTRLKIIRLPSIYNGPVFPLWKKGVTLKSRNRFRIFKVEGFLNPDYFRDQRCGNPTTPARLRNSPGVIPIFFLNKRLMYSG